MHMWTGGTGAGGVLGGFTYGRPHWVPAVSGGGSDPSPPTQASQAGRGWMDPVRGGEPEPSSAQPNCRSQGETGGGGG